MQKRKTLIICGLITALVLSLALPCSASAKTEAESNYSLSKIGKSWKELTDEKLNEYIGNNNDADLYDFISAMNSSDRALLRSKETMLNNTISVDRGEGGPEKMLYYDWIMKTGEQLTPSTFRMARGGTVSTFTAKSGYCFYRFVDNNSGYVVRYKVTFTLDSTENAESEYNNYTVGSVIYSTGGENKNNTKLNKVTFEKQKVYMKKAATSHVELSDGTEGMIRDGKRVYPTAITPIFVLTVKVPKPMYTYGEWNTENFSIDGVAQQLAKGSRFNFSDYNWQCTGETTFDNKVYHTEQVDTLTSCVNILSCGFTVDNTGSLGLAEGVPEVDTINVVYKHPVLNIDFYANGGEVEANGYNTEGTSPVRRSVLYNKVYNSEFGLPEVAALGFKKSGCTPVKGAEWKTYDGSKAWDEANTGYRAVGLMDFEDGTYFTSKLRSMYANWDGRVYKVTLDNQGADFSGTEYTWYKYNTFGTETLSDGSVQKNYFYTTEALAVPLRDGYKIVRPTKDGYTFKGYFTQKNGQGTKYVDASGCFINQLWKKVGPHTLYALWGEKPPEIGKLVIRRTLAQKDYYSSHGDSTFVFEIESDTGELYYRTISFTAADVVAGKDGCVTLQTECILPYGTYTVDAIGVFRYENLLTDISSGSIVADDSGRFELNRACEEVVASYEGGKTDWQRFSHNDLLINSLDE